MVPVISLHLYPKWSKIVKTGGKLESQGFSFFTIVKISTTESVILHRVYYLKRKIMARPIRNTPILMGDDAERFLHEISNLPTRKISTHFYKRVG